jgi:surface antigen Omp85-like protein
MVTAEHWNGLAGWLGGVAMALALILLPARLFAQADSTSEWFAPPAAESPSRGAPAAPEDVGRDSAVVNPDKGGTTFAVAPIPNYNSQFGFGVALVGMAFRKMDAHPETPPSTGMLLGYASDNGTWGTMLMGIGHFAGDAWRAAGGIGYFKLFYDFFGFGTDAGTEGESIEIKQPVSFIFGQGLRRVSGDLYGGVRAQYVHSEFSINSNTVPPELAPFVGLSKSVNSLGLAPVVQFDSRDNTYYPIRGWNSSLATTMSFDGFASDSTYQRTYGYIDFYHGWAEGRQVLALGVDGCYVSGDVPLSNYCSIGELKGIRGYQVGRYQDRFQASFQAEYRRKIGGRFGGVVFGGLAGISATPSQFDGGDLRAAAGVGVRFQLTKKYPLNYRVDAAFGADGAQFYVAVAEAF